MGGSESKPQPKPPSPVLPPLLTEFDKPWRETPWGEKEVLKKDLGELKLSDSKVKYIRILLAGDVGAGKSSFINSVNSAFQGRITTEALAEAASGFAKSFTKTYRTYSIRNGQSVLPFVFNDIMGLEADESAGAHQEDEKSAGADPEDKKSAGADPEDKKSAGADPKEKKSAGADPEDIAKALEGLLKEGFNFDPAMAVSAESDDCRSETSPEDLTYCLVYVIAANNISLMNKKVIEKIKCIRQKASSLEIPQVLIMTKVDEACPLVEKDLRKIYTSKKIKQKMQECSNSVGVPMCHIFPVKNYHEEIDTQNDIDVLILRALTQIVHIADDLLNRRKTCSEKRSTASDSVEKA